MELTTPRLRLEPWAPAHAELLAGLAADPAVMRFIGAGTPWAPAHVEAVAEAQARHWAEHGFGWRAALDRESGAPVGIAMLSFAGEGAGVAAGEYELGWWLAVAAQGRGLAREAAAALRDEAFERVGAPSVVARIQPANARSIAVAESIGLRYDRPTSGRFGERVHVYRTTRGQTP